MNLDIYNTHMEIYPYEKGEYEVIENMYTAVDKFSQKEVPCGYLIDNNKLYLPRGTQIARLETILNTKATYKTSSDVAEKMSRKYYPLYEPRNKLQEESVKFLCGENNKQLALNLSTGFGKMEPISRKIPTPTPEGYTLMGDLKVGDFVFDRFGNPSEILDIFDHGIQKIYKVSFEDGRYALCGNDHLWSIIGDGDKYLVYTTEELRRLYEISIIPNHSLDEFSKYIPVCNAVNFTKQSINIDPWAMGVILNSYITTSSPLALCKPQNIDHYTWDNVIINIICNLCGFTRETFYDVTYLFKNNRIVNTKDIIGNNLNDRRIPNDYMFNDISVRKKLLSGIIDPGNTLFVNDSSNSSLSTIHFKNNDIKFLEDIRQIILSFGYECSINYDNNELVFDEIALSSTITDNSNRGLKISSIKLMGSFEARCITVDNPEHLYLTEDYIVTHNTFCVAYSVTKLNEKALIITPNEGLKIQWIGTFHKMFDYKPSNLMNIAGSNIMNAIMEDLVEPADVYFVNHQTLRSYLNANNGYILHKFFKKLNVGIKVYDEAHMEFGNILLMDFFSNTNRTWYLTATFDRSDNTESVCFKRAFNSVLTYGEIESANAVVKHVIYHIVNINSRISPKDRARVIGYQGMSSHSYGKYAFLEDSNETAYNAICIILDKIKNIEGKTLIFVPLIEAVDKVCNKLKHDFPEKTFGVYHSKVSKEEKEDSLNKDVIISTIKSCGTGKDIKGLRCVISAEPIASKVVAAQMIGRLRPYAKDKDTYFFDIVDVCIAPINWWFKSRFKKIETLVKKVINLNLEK